MKFLQNLPNKSEFITSLLLIFLYILVTFLHIYNQNKLLEVQKQGFESIQIAYELKTSSEDLTKYVRTYVVTENPKYEEKFWHVLDVRNGLAPRPDGRKVPLKVLMRELGFTESELSLLEKAQDNSDELVITENIAMNAVKGRLSAEAVEMKNDSESNKEFARRIVFDENYHNKKQDIMDPISRFIAKVNKRSQKVYERYNRLSLFYIVLDAIIIIALIITLLSLLNLSSAALRKEQEHSKKLFDKQNEVLGLIKLINQKSTFVAGLSHDIRSPIYSEQKALEAIMSKKLGTELEDYFEALEDIYKTNEDILCMVNNYLALYDFESGNVELNYQVKNIEELINTAVRSLRYLAIEHKSEINVIVEENLPLAKIDSDLILSVLINLISNAIKHNKYETEVIISAKSVDNNIEISIKDNGSGIKEEDMPAIFEKYPTKKRKIGTGLGLYLSKQIVEAHKGNIWFTTEGGKGTTFTFSLPIYN